MRRVTAEAQTPAPPPAPPSFAERLRAAPVSAFFFACCIGVFALASRTGSTQEISTLIRWGATERSLVWGGEYWRLFTAMFLHIGIVHLLWNVWAGFSWTAPFERIVGGPRFAFIYLMSGAAGSAASVIGHDAVSAGASGALFGVIGGVLVIQRKVLGSWRGVWNEPGLRQNLVMMALWLVAGPFLGFDSFAHGGGMVAGAMLTWALLPLRVPLLAGAVVVILGFVGASTRPWPKLHDGYFARQAVIEAVEKRDWKAVLAATDKGALDSELASYRAQAFLFSDAVDEAEKVLPLITSEQLPAYRVKTMVHLVAGKDAEALKEANAGLVLHPEDIPLLTLRASVLMAKGDAVNADKDAEHLLQLTPGAPAAVLLRAETLAATHRAAQALKSLEGLDGSADPAKVAAMRVRLLILLGRKDDAWKPIRTEGGLGDEDRAMLRCTLEAAEGAFELAEVSCGRLGADAAELKAALAVGRGECEVARGHLHVAANRRVTPFGESVLGLCALREGDVGEAERHAVQALSVDATNVNGLLLKLAIGTTAGEPAAAVAALKGLEVEASASVLWPILPDAAKALLPR